MDAAGFLASDQASDLDARVDEHLCRARAPMVTTSFGLHSAATLHRVTRIRPDIVVVWIDTGFNTAATYHHAERLAVLLDLDLRVYAPDLTPARIEAVMGGVPDVGDASRHAVFSREVKLRPFQRALTELAPDMWFTGIRRSQTPARETMSPIHRDARGILKVAPLFEYTDDAVEAYLTRHALPLGDPAYVDPVKALAHRECGLHRPRPSAAPR